MFTALLMCGLKRWKFCGLEPSGRKLRKQKFKRQALKHLADFKAMFTGVF